MADVEHDRLKTEADATRPRIEIDDKDRNSSGLRMILDHANCLARSAVSDNHWRRNRRRARLAGRTDKRLQLSLDVEPGELSCGPIVDWIQSDPRAYEAKAYMARRLSLVWHQAWNSSRTTPSTARSQG